MLCNGSFQDFEDPKNNEMNGLIGYLESMVQLEPNQHMWCLWFLFFGDIHDNVQIKNKVKGLD